MTRAPRQSLSFVAAALLLAGALGAWQARRVAAALWPAEPAQGPGAGRTTRARASGATRAEERGGGAPAGEPASQLAAAPVAAAGRSAAEGAGGTGGPAEPRTEAELKRSAELVDEMRRLARDLEFNAGLPEPPQQLAVQPPEPWRPAVPEERQVAPVINGLEPLAGAEGTRVTIRGSHLRATQVMFGLSPADIVSASAEAVTVVAPPGAAGPAMIALTNDDGSYALAATPFTYGR